MCIVYYDLHTFLRLFIQAISAVPVLYRFRRRDRSFVYKLCLLLSTLYTSYSLESLILVWYVVVWFIAVDGEDDVDEDDVVIARSNEVDDVDDDDDDDNDEEAAEEEEEAEEEEKDSEHDVFSII